ncbi:acylneuraminate cytidylyltransferase family protein [Candidatus Pseudothioglobus singularis]|nr:acylneuraminate cytidylyltransferase family protein [Candidatus Pseudothioglobus singularis]
MNIHCIILARGGSKGIPKKNIISFCGKPLLAWTIEQCLKAKYISNVWVSSDDDDILDVAEQYGAKKIKRPQDISADTSTSESAWLHAIDYLTDNNIKIDVVLAPQVTSPLRETIDINNAITKFIENNYDSLFSASITDDLYFWEESKSGINSINYDYKNRRRRQDFKEQIIENGSFYLFKPKIIQNNHNRFSGKIGFSKMDFWKMFEIDNEEDFRMCSALMKEFLIKE